MMNDISDSGGVRFTTAPVPGAIVWSNVLIAVITAAAAVLATASPALVVPGEVAPLVDFYAQAYLVRAIPISAVLIGLLATKRPGLRPVLLLAGLAQVGDVIVGTLHAQPVMVAGATLGAVVHLGSAWFLRRKELP
jgi:hypothetical protein